MRLETWKALTGYLDRLCHAEYIQQRAEHVKRGRRAGTFPGKYVPSEYVQQLVALLGEGDEEGFKRLKAEQGYVSHLRH